jgi:hypothetical protein
MRIRERIALWIFNKAAAYVRARDENYAELCEWLEKTSGIFRPGVPQRYFNKHLEFKWVDGPPIPSVQYTNISKAGFEAIYYRGIPIKFGGGSDDK